MDNTRLFTINIKLTSEEETKTYQCSLINTDVVTVRTAVSEDAITPTTQIIISNDNKDLPSTYTFINDLIQDKKLNTFGEIQSIIITDGDLVLNSTLDNLSSIENMYSSSTGGQTIININSIIKIVSVLIKE